MGWWVVRRVEVRGNEIAESGLGTVAIAHRIHAQRFMHRRSYTFVICYRTKAVAEQPGVYLSPILTLYKMTVTSRCQAVEHHCF